METSLKAAGDREIFCFLHYPPRYRGYQCPEILQLLERYRVSRCYYAICMRKVTVWPSMAWQMAQNSGWFPQIY